MRWSKIRTVATKRSTGANGCACAARLDSFWMGLHARYFALIFFRMRRSSMKQSPEVVQSTQPIIMITFMSIRAGSLSRRPAELYTNLKYTTRKIQQKAHSDCCHSSFAVSPMG